MQTLKASILEFNEFLLKEIKAAEKVNIDNKEAIDKFPDILQSFNLRMLACLAGGFLKNQKLTKKEEKENPKQSKIHKPAFRPIPNPQQLHDLRCIYIEFKEKVESAYTDYQESDDVLISRPEDGKMNAKKLNEQMCKALAGNPNWDDFMRFYANVSIMTRKEWVALSIIILTFVGVVAGGVIVYNVHGNPFTKTDSDNTVECDDVDEFLVEDEEEVPNPVEILDDGVISE